MFLIDFVITFLLNINWMNVYLFMM